MLYQKSLLLIYNSIFLYHLLYEIQVWSCSRSGPSLSLTVLSLLLNHLPSLLPSHQQYYHSFSTIYPPSYPLTNILSLLLTHLPSLQPSHQHIITPSHPPTYLASHLLTYPPTYPPTLSPTHLPSQLRSQLPSHLCILPPSLSPTISPTLSPTLPPTLT